MASDRLTPREQQIITLLQDGHANKEIAHRMGVAHGTVKVYLNRIFRALGVSTRLELVVKLQKQREADANSAVYPGAD